MERRKNQIVLYIILLICLLVLIMLPDSYLMHTHADLGLGWLFSSLLLAAPLSIVVMTLPWVWLQILLLSVLLFVSMLEVSTVFTYYNFINAISFPAFVYANTSEMGDMTYYISHYTSRHEILPFALYIVSIVLFFLIKRQKQGNFKERKTCLGVSIVCVMLCFIFGGDKLYAHSPYHVSREIARAIQMGQTREDHLPLRANFTYNAQDDGFGNNIVVLAIGESLNYKHCSFDNQYHRNTTPRLENKANMISFTNCFSAATYTEQSLPLLLTRAQADHLHTAYEELPIQTAFKEAGYKTYVVSHKNQIMNNGVDGYLLEGADSVLFVDSDADIMQKLKELAPLQGKVFVLLHFSGSHFFYDNYPQCCNQWRPNYNYDKESVSDSLFINAYDNSILYTDSLLSACIEYLQLSDRVATLIFTSDHGEYLDAHIGGHGLSCRPTKDEYHVPLLVWYSDEYAEANPDKIANMARHKDEPVCADHVFWSVLDMAGIRIDSTLQQEGMSIFGDSLLPHPRTLLLPDGKTVMDLD